jgi:hypothetical protein
MIKGFLLVIITSLSLILGACTQDYSYSAKPIDNKTLVQLAPDVYSGHVYGKDRNISGVDPGLVTVEVRRIWLTVQDIKSDQILGIYNGKDNSTAFDITWVGYSDDVNYQIAPDNYSRYFSYPSIVIVPPKQFRDITINVVIPKNTELLDKFEFLFLVKESSQSGFLQYQNSQKWKVDVK